MNTQPLVSIILPVFNAQDFIEEAINSVLNQAYKNIEVIVIDDGSTDQSVDIIKKYEPQIIFFQQANSGPAASRNRGISVSNGSYLCFLDADDIMLHDRISSHVDFMENHPEIGLTFCDYINFNNEGYYPHSHFRSCKYLMTKLNSHYSYITNETCLLLARENFGLSGSVFLRKEILKSNFYFDETLRFSEDFYFYFLLARHYPVGIINKIGLKRRFHSNNLTNNRYRLLIDCIRTRTLLKNNEKSPEIRFELDRYIQQAKFHLANLCVERGEIKLFLKLSVQVLLNSIRPKLFFNALHHIVRAIFLKLFLVFKNLNIIRE